MAYVRISPAEARGAGDVDPAKIDATTEEDLRRPMIEDDRDPDAPLGPWRNLYPPAAIRNRTGLSQVEIAARLRTPIETWPRWEDEPASIDATARSFLARAGADPERAFKAIAA